MTLPRIPPSRCTGTFRDQYLTTDTWVGEPKLDGGRYQLVLDTDGTAHFYSRRDYPRLDKARNIPHIALRYPGLEGTILDGEILHPTGTKLGDTTGIMNSLPAHAVARQKKDGWLRYHVFDILYARGEAVLRKPLAERRTLLEDILGDMHNPHCVLVPQTRNKSELWDSIVSQGGEGIVLKNLCTAYGIDWVKMKRMSDFSVIVTGFQRGEGKYNNTLGAICVSVYDDTGRLVEVGKASGMTDEEREMIWKQQAQYTGTVVDIFAQEITKDGRLRHPRWHRFRPDVSPTLCTFAKLRDDMQHAQLARRPQTR